MTRYIIPIIRPPLVSLTIYVGYLLLTERCQIKLALGLPITYCVWKG